MYTKYSFVACHTCRAGQLKSFVYFFLVNFKIGVIFKYKCFLMKQRRRVVEY